MNVQHEAGRFGEVSTSEKAFDIPEDLGVVAMDLKHPLHRPEDARIIVDDDDEMASARD